MLTCVDDVRMNKDVVHVFSSGLLFALVLATVCLGSNWIVRGTSPIIVPDDYSTIQEAVNNADEGDTIFVSNGIYYEHVVVNKTVSLVGEDVSATIVDGDNTGTVVYIVSDYVNVTGFTVQRSGNVQLDAGICLNNSAGCVVSGNLLIDNGFCGISLLYSQQNMIIDNNVNRSSWGGIHMLASSYNLVSRNIVDNTYGGINGHVSSNYNNITENAISNSAYGMFYHAASNNIIYRNNVSTIAVDGIWLQDQASYNVVAENSLINNTVAIRLEGPNYNNVLSRNIITGAEYGIKIQNAGNTLVAENVIVNNNAGNDSWRAGIRLDYGAYSVIDSNFVSGNYYGVLLYSSSPYVSVYGNSIVGNEFGLRVAGGGSSYLNATLNLVAHNRGYGIELTGFSSSSNYATVYENTIVNNSDGIALGQYSSYNTILQNNISMNDYGFYIEYSAHNVIHRNSIVNNSQQAYVAAGSVNTWDDGYLSGGNYWSDYNGTDLCRGLGQNETGSDGIGDMHYTIDENNEDTYPLMGPFGSLVTEGENLTQFPAEGVGLTFGNVTEGGFTTVNKTSIGSAPPQDFKLLGQYYDINTTAIYSGSIRIRIVYDDSTIAEGEEKALKLMQWNETLQEWVNMTTDLDIQSNIVFGETTHLSLFGVFVDYTIFIDGDVNYDGVVDMVDIDLCCDSFGSHPENPKWNSHCDINEDSTVDMRDIGIACRNYMKKME
jgi:parallel beta-helix repeat protein